MWKLLLYLVLALSLQAFALIDPISSATIQTASKGATQFGRVVSFPQLGKLIPRRFEKFFRPKSFSASLPFLKRGQKGGITTANGKTAKVDGKKVAKTPTGLSIPTVVKDAPSNGFTKQEAAVDQKRRTYGTLYEYLGSAASYAYSIVYNVVYALMFIAIYLAIQTFNGLSWLTDRFERWLDRQRIDLFYSAQEEGNSLGFWYYFKFTSWIFAGFIFAFIQGAATGLRLLWKHLAPLLLFFLLMAFFVWIQESNNAIFNFAHGTTLLGQMATNKFTGLVNTGKDVLNVVTPITNVQTYLAVDSAMIAYNAFANKDSIVESLTNGFDVNLRRRLRSIHIDNFGNSQAFDTSLLVKQLGGIIEQVTPAMHMYGKFMNLLFQITLALIVPFLQPILTILGYIFPKALCLLSGGLLCATLELFNLGVNVLVTLLVDLLKVIPFLSGLQPPVINAGCPSGMLSTVEPSECGGSLLDSEPPGAAYTAFKGSVVSSSAESAQSEQVMSDYLSGVQSFADSGGNRRLSALAPPSVEHRQRHLLRCEYRAHDRTWVERFEGRVVHHSQHTPCHHTREILLGESEEWFLPFHHLGVDDIDDVCVTVNLLDEGHVRACYISPQEQTLHTTMNRTALDSIWSRLFNQTLATPIQELDEDGEESGTTRDLSSKTYTRADAIELLQQQRQQQLGNSFTIQGKVQCEVDHTRTNRNLDETLVDGACVIAQLYERGGVDALQRKWGQPTISKYGRRQLRQHAKIVNHTHVRSLGKQLNQVIQSWKRQVQIMDLARESGKDHLMRRVLRDIQSEDNIYYVGLKQSLRALETALSATPKQEEEPRRRRLSTSDPGLDASKQPVFIGSCPSNTYPCENAYQCVDKDAMDTCIPLSEADDPSAIQRASQAVRNFATMDFDVKGYLSREAQCWREYKTKPSTLPFSTINLHAEMNNMSSNSRYCLGLVQPLTYSIPAVEENGILSYTSQLLCNGTDAATSICVCPWYYPTLISADAMSFNLVHVFVVNHLLNFLITVQYMIYYFLTSWILIYVDYAWRGFAYLVCGDQCEPWFFYLLGNMGLDHYSSTQRWLCVGIHTGSTLLVMFGVFILWLGFQVAYPILDHIWCIFDPLYVAERDRDRQDWKKIKPRERIIEWIGKAKTFGTKKAAVTPHVMDPSKTEQAKAEQAKEETTTTNKVHVDGLTRRRRKTMTLNTPEVVDV